MTFNIQPFDLKNSTHTEYSPLNDFENTIRKERVPDDPAIPLEENIASWQNVPAFIEVKSWVAWTADRSAIIGAGDVVIMRTNENQHVAQFNIRVLPEYRRRGMGHAFLRLIVAAVEQAGRRLLITNTVSTLMGGEAFMKRLGASKGMEAHTNQLVLADLDRALIEKWKAQAREKAIGFTLGLWTGAYPEEKIQEIVHLVEVMNSAPLDDLDVEDFHFTAEQLREMEKEMVASGTQRWTFYVQEAATDKFAGYTELMWNPNRPKIAFQGATGVFPEYRNKGLGRWLKAAMLEKILTERPQVEFIRTGNANSNAPMLKINHELGFKPFIANCLWQIELEKAKAYLSDK